MAKVLIIEDEPSIALILTELLRGEGHETVTATNGAAGLEALVQPPLPDVVLLDLFMPGVDGRAVLESMRSDGGLADIPVILITGAVPSATDFPPRGAYQHLIQKPFNLNDVAEAVRTWADRRAS